MAITAPEDPSSEVQRSRNKMEVASAKPEMDEKELAEREEATQAYAGEDEPHFVAYLNDCVQMSRDSMKDIRDEQAECWDVFNEKEPANYAFKEAWQSRAVLPKPNIYVMAFLAVISKAFDPQFLSIENEQNKEDAEFIRKLMSLMMSKSFSGFPINFIDATQMGAAVGQSMEMIPMWRPMQGPYWDLIEPWKIHRDPDSLSRQPQSGMYWIHQEWLDYHDLKKMEKNGVLQNLQDCGPGGQWGNPSSDNNIDPNELKRRRDMLYQQSSFRTKVLTSEFYGTILDRRGEELLPNSNYWVVADRVVKLPKISPYPTLRWPGTSFSPLPHLLRHDGRSLLTGLKSLWYAMCNLFALHIDNLNWTVNPQKEIDISGEEAALRLEVRLHVAVEVEVILAEVGEDEDGEAHAVEPVQLRRVRRRLHRARAVARVEHLAERALEVDRFRCRAQEPRRSPPTRASTVPSSPGLRPAAARIA